jgi:hypothetical protein
MTDAANVRSLLSLLITYNNLASSKARVGTPYVKARGQIILSVVNVPESAIAGESHAVLPTLAGPEIGVASTRAFTTQLTLTTAIAAGLARGTLASGDEERLTQAMIEVPAQVNEVPIDDALLYHEIPSRHARSPPGLWRDLRSSGRCGPRLRAGAC